MEEILKKLESEYLDLLLLRSEPNEMYSSEQMDEMINSKRKEIINNIEKCININYADNEADGIVFCGKCGKIK